MVWEFAGYLQKVHTFAMIGLIWADPQPVSGVCWADLHFFV